MPASASIAAAIVAARSARKSRAAEMDAARIRDLEDRLEGRRYDMYKPMIDLLRRMLETKKTGAQVSEKETIGKLSEFSAWISMFGSDDAVRAFHNFMQGAYHNPPAPIAMRLYADFLLAARRDMGDNLTATTQSEILGMRVNDLYDDPKYRDIAELPFLQLCEQYEWSPPWLTGRSS